jgi:hypothetical protein
MLSWRGGRGRPKHNNFSLSTKSCWWHTCFEHLYPRITWSPSCNRRSTSSEVQTKTTTSIEASNTSARVWLESSILTSNYFSPQPLFRLDPNRYRQKWPDPYTQVPSPKPSEYRMSAQFCLVPQFSPAMTRIIAQRLRGWKMSSESHNQFMTKECTPSRRLLQSRFCITNTHDSCVSWTDFDQLFLIKTTLFLIFFLYFFF